jgi:hypothetical protein
LLIEWLSADGETDGTAMESGVAQMALRGKWAEGIEPRHFQWIVKDRLAICERPGGYGHHHRPVRRMEEIIWIRRNDFDRVVSMIDAPHNLHNYDEYEINYVHRPITLGDHLPEVLETTYTDFSNLLQAGERLLVHHEELGDTVCGAMAGYLLWAGMVTPGPRAVTVIEQITGRVLGPTGREIVAMAGALPSAAA